MQGVCGVFLGTPTPPHSNTTQGAGATGSGPPRPDLSTCIYVSGTRKLDWGWMGGGGGGRDSKDITSPQSRQLFLRGLVGQDCSVEGRSPGRWWDGPLVAPGMG